MISNMKFILAAFLIASSSAYGQIVAAGCGEANGYSNYHYKGGVSKQDSGFVKDSPFSVGEIQVERKRDGGYDLLLISNGVKVLSTVDDGGKVHLLRQSNEGATFLVLSENRIIEVFTFWMDPQGQPRFDVMQSMDDRAGRNSLFTGTCRILDLSVPMK